MPSTVRQIEMASIPSMTQMLLKASTARKKAQAEPEFLPLTVTARGIRADRKKLARFRAVCGYESTDTLPLPYPHIMAFALHMQLMLEPEFPFTPRGAVHIRNWIRQQRIIRTDEPLDFEVRFGAAEEAGKGYEVGIITEVSIEGELIWEELSVLLVRKGGTGARKDKKPVVDAPQYRELVQWHLAANKGRQYAAASGDYNPIHLYPATAKLMGFKRQIMHGMWSKSRAVAHLLPEHYDGPLSVDVSFKLPVFLPATVTLMYNSDDSGCQFEMRDGRCERPHLAGEIVIGDRPI